MHLSLMPTSTLKKVCSLAAIWSSKQINARLITYFGNFVFGFSSLRLRDFLYDVFRLQGKMGKTKWKINKLLRNILVTSSPKTTNNEVTKMGWNAHKRQNEAKDTEIVNT